jgi:hypothetical protein
MSDWINSGISGVGNLNVENLAVGANSKIEQTKWSEPAARQLADLQSAIDAYQGPPATRDALSEAHAEIAAELRAPAPDRDKLLARLTSLSGLAGPASAIVQAATALAQVIAAIR